MEAAAAVMVALSVVAEVYLGYLCSLQAVLRHWHYIELVVGIELVETEPELAACLALVGLLVQVKQELGAWLYFHNPACTYIAAVYPA